MSLVPFDKIGDRGGQLTRLQIAATVQFAGDVLGNIFRPALGGIEGDDADRVTILAGQQVLNYRFEVGGFVIGLPPRRSLIDRNHPPPSKPFHRCRSGRSTASNWNYA